MIVRIAGFALVVAVTLGGCKRTEVGFIASCDLSAADPAKSGNPTSMKECIDYSDGSEPLEVEDARHYCADLGGVVLAGKCPIAGASWRCRPNGPANSEFVFYAPTAPADASKACTIMQGTLGTP